MIYALSKNNEKIEASTGENAICPNCMAPVIAKCGEINRWHWAHKSKSECDSWTEPESEWHRNWKSRFNRDCVEIPIVKNNVKHIADVCMQDGFVVEFQNSNLPVEEVRERESFYKNMVWIFNVMEPYENDRLLLRKTPSYYTFRWKQPKKIVSFAKKKVFLHFDEKYLLELKKIHIQAPCGGWGYLWTIDDFLKRCHSHMDDPK